MVAVTRVQGANAVSRKEVRDFFADQKQASLFLQAFAVLQARDPKDPKSYAQVSSIHGLPNTDGSLYLKLIVSTCNSVHGQALFPTWHRPYIALLETLLVEAATEIAHKYTTDTQAWVSAAQSIRFPYLDWANDATISQGLPSVLVDPSVTILAAPSDSFPNDLGPLKSFNNTVRFPTSSSPDATSDVNALQTAFKRLAPQLLGRFLEPRVGLFAPTPGNYHSLEYIHDQVHGTISGNGGHMGYPEVAAYDPIFYFHHCNVDRLLALYESIFNVYVDAGLAGQALAPFKIVDGTNQAWTSNDAHDVTSFGYTYPELGKSGKSCSKRFWLSTVLPAPAPAPVASEKPESLIDEFKGLFKGLFGNKQQQVIGQTFQRNEIPEAQPAAPPAAPPLNLLTTHRLLHPHKNAVNGPFTVKFTVGERSVDAYIFARLKRDMCANCIDLDDLTDKREWKGAVSVSVYNWKGEQIPCKELDA
ncbi:Di-copper centre-containing protein [Rhizoclosmatium globosum]|uniref:tyrosinase n=1 Tax=Rhizoclosmatium globosum TaxID=329046 RepID=A0A1Y2B8A2_9FUNG|nr:Di-copper centre-containing protein [Rhizoclosmatium globosum]|eukprot:ORY30727.1 Di-copper centre-containing protein [Rhizoclosmatium globosum]